MKRMNLNQIPGGQGDTLYTIIEKLRRMLADDGKARPAQPTLPGATANENAAVNPDDEAVNVPAAQNREAMVLSRRNDWRTVR